MPRSRLTQRDRNVIKQLQDTGQRAFNLSSLMLGQLPIYNEELLSVESSLFDALVMLRTYRRKPTFVEEKGQRA